jgi:hypothetical protein
MNRGRKKALPVAVRRMVILNVSASITCAPELVPVGESRLVMAWIPCSVPARTRYSFDVSCARPSAKIEPRGDRKSDSQSLTGKVSLIDEPAGFIYDLLLCSTISSTMRKERRTYPQPEDGHGDKCVSVVCRN